MVADDIAVIGTIVVAVTGILSVTIIHIGMPCGGDAIAAGVVSGFTATTIAGLLAYRKASETLREVQKQNDAQGQMMRK